MPRPTEPVKRICYADDITVWATGVEISERHLIKEQAGFRSGKSCTSQLLNLIQHIEDGYEEGMILGTAFVDLSAAYDTVNHRLLI